MIHHVDAIRQRHACRQQLGDCANDSLLVKFAFRTVVSAKDQDTAVMPAADHKEDVQILEVVVIVCQHSPVIADGLREVDGVIFACHADVGRHTDIVSRLPQQPRQE
jgi:hypothetical protein